MPQERQSNVGRIEAYRREKRRDLIERVLKSATIQTRSIVPCMGDSFRHQRDVLTLGQGSSAFLSSNLPIHTTPKLPSCYMCRLLTLHVAIGLLHASYQDSLQPDVKELQFVHNEDKWAYLKAEYGLTTPLRRGLGQAKQADEFRSDV